MLSFHWVDWILGFLRSLVMGPNVTFFSWGPKSLGAPLSQHQWFQLQYLQSASLQFYQDIHTQITPEVAFYV